MALIRAVLIGAAAAVAVPYVMRNDPEVLGGWVHRGVAYYDVAHYHVAWSWPLFGLVTLMAWGLLTWANR